jgi:hypothetical protein
LRGCVALALVASAWTCVDQTPVSPAANAIVVHAVLDASARNQRVLVQTTDGRIASQEIVSGATVVILTPDGRTLAADQVIDSASAFGVGAAPPVYSYYQISLDKYGVSLVPGSTYRLHVTLPDGREVTGSTTVPSAVSGVRVSVPASLTSTDSLTLAWPRVAGAIAYDVSVSMRGSLVFETFADTSIVLSTRTEGSNGHHPLYAGSTHQIVVSAVDANFYDYFRRSSDLFTGSGPISHLDGAVGVFGSIVPIASGTVTVK